MNTLQLLLVLRKRVVQLLLDILDVLADSLVIFVFAVNGEKLCNPSSATETEGRPERRTIALVFLLNILEDRADVWSLAEQAGDALRLEVVCSGRERLEPGSDDLKRLRVSELARPNRRAASRDLYADDLEAA